MNFDQLDEFVLPTCLFMHGLRYNDTISLITVSRKKLCIQGITSRFVNISWFNNFWKLFSVHYVLGLGNFGGLSEFCMSVVIKRVDRLCQVITV